jgi:hypothetical protein
MGAYICCCGGKKNDDDDTQMQLNTEEKAGVNPICQDLILKNKEDSKDLDTTLEGEKERALIDSLSVAKKHSENDLESPRKKAA